MVGLHGEFGYGNIAYAIILELVFLSFSLVFVGLGVSEIRKGKSWLKNMILILFGGVLAAVSFYVTYIFIQG